MGTYDTIGGTPRHDPEAERCEPCAVCGKDPGGDCRCPECPTCGEAGRPECYIEHGMADMVSGARDSEWVRFRSTVIETESPGTGAVWQKTHVSECVCRDSLTFAPPPRFRLEFSSEDGDLLFVLPLGGQILDGAALYVRSQILLEAYRFGFRAGMVSGRNALQSELCRLLNAKEKDNA